MASEEPDYLRFRDQALVAIALEQDGSTMKIVDLFELCERHKIPHMLHWVHGIPSDFQAAGYGTDTSSLRSRAFLINGVGLKRAAEVEREQLPRTVVQKLVSDTSQKLINVGVVGISLISLLVSIIALYFSSR